MNAAVALVVAVGSGAGVVIPHQVDDAARREIASALTDAGRRADLVVTFPFDDDSTHARELAPDIAGATADVRQRVAQQVPDDLAAVLGAPQTVVMSRPLSAGLVDNAPLLVQLAFVEGDSALEVTWVAGAEPGAGPSGDELGDGAAPVTEIALSVPVARVWGVQVGDERVLDEGVRVRVSGIFAPVDAQAPAWQQVPKVLQPQRVGGSAARTEVTALLSAQSLPYALYALGSNALSRSFVFAPQPQAVSVAGASHVAAAVRGLSSGRDAFSVFGQVPRVTTTMDRVVDAALERTRAAQSQAMVMLAGVQACAVGALVLAAQALARRRYQVVGLAMRRGASRWRLARLVAVESVSVAVVGGGIGVGVGVMVTGSLSLGTSPWWLIAVVVASGAAPAVAARSHGGFGGTGFGGTLPGGKLAQRRRLVAVTALALVTAMLWAVLVGSAHVAPGIAALAPVCLAAVVAGGVAAVLPWTMRRWRRAQQRRRGAAGLVAAAHATAPLTALVAVVVGSALLTAVASGQYSARSGGVEASWQVVGADAVASGRAGEALPAGSEEVAAGAQVWTALTVQQGVQAVGAGLDRQVTVIAVDPDTMPAVMGYHGGDGGRGFDALARRTPPGGALAVLAPGFGDVGALTVRFDGVVVPIEVAGPVPALPPGIDAPGDVVVISRAALSTATGHSIAATHVWLDGPTAAQIAHHLEANGAEVTIRAEWLDALTESAVAAQGAQLTVLAIVMMAGMMTACVVMWCRTAAAARTRALARLAVLGFATRSRRLVAVGATTVPVVAAVAVGVGVGVAMTGALMGPLGLEALAGGGDVTLRVPVWVAALPLGAGLVAALASLGSARVGPYRLGQVLRQG